MADDFPTPDEIINGTYGNRPNSAKSKEQDGPLAPQPQQQVQLDAERSKAVNLIISGFPFIVIGLRPTFGDADNPTVATGSDFFTAAGGDTETLRAAAPHLEGVLQRLYAKRGWV